VHLVGAYLIGAARVQERYQDATVREEDRGVADCVRLMLDDLARHRSAVRGEQGDEPDQLERDARRALRGTGMPEQVVPVGWVENQTPSAT
jgi:hypothetical protein